jgi:hypothetical protein
MNGQIIIKKINTDNNLRMEREDNNVHIVTKELQVKLKEM